VLGDLITYFVDCGAEITLRQPADREIVDSTIKVVPKIDQNEVYDRVFEELKNGTFCAVVQFSSSTALFLICTSFARVKVAASAFSPKAALTIARVCCLSKPE